MVIILPPVWAPPPVSLSISASIAAVCLATISGGKELLEKKAEIIAGPLADSDMGKKQLTSIDAEIARLTGGGSQGGQSGGKMVTMADIRATAAKQGMTEKQVMDAAKAKGYTIQ